MSKTDLVYDDYKEYEVNQSKNTNFNTTMGQFGNSFTHHFRFPNDYGASVIKHNASYGYEQDLFELAVLSFHDKGEGDICYSTEITSDTIGWLDNDEVLELLERIKNL